jgi:hypothetical protein
VDDLMTSDEYIRSRMPHATVIEVRAALRSEPAALARLSAAGTLLGGRVQCAVCAVRVCASVVQCAPSRPVASRRVASRYAVQRSRRALARRALTARARCAQVLPADKRKPSLRALLQKGMSSAADVAASLRNPLSALGLGSGGAAVHTAAGQEYGGGMGVGLPGAAEAGQPWWGAGAGAGGGGGGVMNASASASAGGRAPDPTRPL